MSLSAQEASRLFELLAMHSELLPTVAAEFARTFAKPDHFRILSVLTVLLGEADVLQNERERIVALSLLYEPYKTEPVDLNPFLPLFVDTATPDRSSRRFVSSVERFHSTNILNSAQQFLNLSTIQVVEESKRFNPLPTVHDLAKLNVVCAQRWKDMTPAQKSGVYAILSEPVEGNSMSTDRSSSGFVELLSQTNVLQSTYLHPTLHRPVPPLVDCTPEEITWLYPAEIQPQLQWDDSMCVDDPKMTDLRQIIERALQVALPLQQEQTILSYLEQLPSLTFHLGLTPEKFTSLVQLNPAVATAVLLQFCLSSQNIDYIRALVHMDFTLHSIEVVNRLTTQYELPSELLHLYIDNCIQKCENMQDKKNETRLIRLLCVFLQSLIRNKLIDRNDESLFVVIERFSVQFVHIKEALQLFTLIKSGNAQM